MNAPSRFARMSLNTGETTGRMPSEPADLDGTIQTRDPQSTIACSTAGLDAVEEWILNELPDCNEQTDVGVMTPDEFLDEAAKRMRTVQAAVGSANELSKPVAKRTLKLLGFLVGSTERHFQFAGCPKGTTWNGLPDVEKLMADVAASIGLPPILSTSGYWLEDRGCKGLTFTGTAAEKSFKGCVQV